jgi:hypothetical protein
VENDSFLTDGDPFAGKKNAPKGVFLPASLSLSSWDENSFGF